MGSCGLFKQRPQGLAREEEVHRSTPSIKRYRLLPGQRDFSRLVRGVERAIGILVVKQ